MNVYIEYVVADNLTIDSLLLWAAAITLKLPYKRWRIVLGGAVGAACAVASVFVSGWLVYLVKAVCLVVMCVTVVGFGKKLLWYILLTAAYTFVLGGAIIAVFYFFNVGYVTESGQFYDLDVPLFVYVLAAFFTGFLCYAIAFYVKRTKAIAPYLTEARVIMGDKRFDVSAFYDSGNALVFDCVPVCFVTKKFKGFADYFAEQTLKGCARQIDVSTVAGNKTVLAVPAEVECRGKRLSVYLALPSDKCKTSYNLLLSNAFDGDTTATLSVS